MSEIKFVGLQLSQLDQLEKLLAAEEMPFEDCREHLENFYGVFDGEQLIVAGAIQVSGGYALLRSVVVASAYKSNSYGFEITQFLIAKARQLNLKAIYLLTMTAQAYFLKHGFVVVNRVEVPAEIQATAQFKGLCPGSASCMLMPLDS